MAQMWAVSSQLLVLSIFSMCVAAAFGLRITSPPELANNTVLSPIFRCISSNTLDTEGPMLAWEHVDVNNPAHIESLNGSIVLISSTYTQSSRLGVDLHPARWALEWLQQRGVRGVVVMNAQSNQPGGNEVLVDSYQWCAELYPMVVTEIGLADGKVMTEWANTYKDQIYVLLPIGENSWWRDVRQSTVMIVIQVILAVFAFATSALAFAKLVGYVRARGFKLHLPHVLLTSEFITNLWRAVYFAIDPIYLGRWFAGPASHGLSTFTWSITIINTVLLALYYQELLTNRKLLVATFLNRLKIPFFVITGVIVILEVISSSLRASRIGTLYVLVYITSAYYAIFQLAVAIFFFYISHKVLAFLKSSAGLSNSGHRRHTLKKTSIFLVLAGVANIIFTLGLISIALPTFWTPPGHYFGWTLAYLGCILESFIQTVAIRMPGGAHDTLSGAKPSHSHSLGRTGSKPNLNPTFSGRDHAAQKSATVSSRALSSTGE